jgi:DHA1 family bicyclomycin/chloramphenicol resistance-like MFS transporter
VLGGLTCVGAAATDMYAPAFPAVSDDLHASASGVQTTVAVYLLGLAIGQLLVGSASDALGRRVFIIGGTIGFGISSLLCSFAPNLGVLIALRLVQGLTAAAGIVVARAVVQDLHQGAAATRYFSRLIMITGLAPVLAPSIGALLLRGFSWRSIFIAQAVLAVLLVLMAVRALPESLPVANRRPFTVKAIVAQNVELLTDRRFLSFAIAYGLAAAIIFAYVGGYTFVIQDVYGQSPTTYGILFGVNGLGMVILAQVNGWLVRPNSIVMLARTGLIVSTLAAGLLVALLAGHAPLFLVVSATWMVVATRGFIMPNVTSMAMAIRLDSRGSASAVLGTLQSASGAVAAPLAGLGGRSSGVPMATIMFVLSAAAVLVVWRALGSRPANRSEMPGAALDVVEAG